ncbi:MAG: MarR family winged helix-turn-helix transcriptional regulator [Myxococcota bacterium]
MTDPRATFDAAAAASLGQLLLKSARLLDERALARLREVPGAHPVRPAHTRLFPHISHEGIRATTIAARLGVTKQAVAPLVADLVGWGLVEQIPDPTDGRASLLRWTAHGVDSLHQGLGILAEFEAQLSERVGREQVQHVAQVLAELIDLLEG